MSMLFLIKRAYDFVRSEPLICSWVDQHVRPFIRAKAPQKGQGLVEYALILVLVAIVVIVVLSL